MRRVTSMKVCTLISKKIKFIYHRFSACIVLYCIVLYFMNMNMNMNM